jgi:hypothetical protein
MPFVLEIHNLEEFKKMARMTASSDVRYAVLRTVRSGKIVMYEKIYIFLTFVSGDDIVRYVECIHTGAYPMTDDTRNKVNERIERIIQEFKEIGITLREGVWKTR